MLLIVHLYIAFPILQRCSSFDEALENNITSGILTGARLRSLSFDEGLKKFQLQDENK